ncbi:MAG: S8 family serine peptidase, partial [Acidimicrobiia bacterium]
MTFSTRALFLALIVALMTLPRGGLPVAAQERERAVPAHPDRPGLARADEYLVKVGDGGPEALGPLAGGWKHPVGNGWALVSHPSGDTPPALEAARLSQQLGLPVEPNYVFELFPTDEPLFDNQWGLHNIGQEGGTPDADIDAPEAWNTTVGDPGTVVAVIDSGLDFSHPEFEGQLWEKDDLNGWDFVEEDDDPSDEDGHGTHLAGTVAAAVNGEGVAGTASGSRLMILRACSDNKCSVGDVVQAIDFAVDEGASIINISFGGSFPSPPVEDAIEAAGEAGVLVVAAAGNSGTDNDQDPIYPASLEADNLVAVAATNRNDGLASFSNYGETSVDLGAPGVDVLSTFLESGYAWGDGTSFAAPHVSGAAALVRSANPCLNPAEVRQLLTDSVDVRPGLQGKTVSGGRLNAAGAIDLATASSAAPTFGTVPLAVQFEAGDGCQGSVTYSWDFGDGSKGDGASVTHTYGVGIFLSTLAIADETDATFSIIAGVDFADDDDSIFENDIIWLSAAGITKGCNPPTNDRFCPDDPVTRGQMAAFLVRAFQLLTGPDRFVDDEG